MSETVLGTDTSHWDGTLNFNTMWGAGAKFWITKATDSWNGNLFEDDRFDIYMKDATAQGKLLKGCYHWLQPNVDPTIAADFYLERYHRFNMEFPAILDFEEPSVRETGKFGR